MKEYAVLGIILSLFIALVIYPVVGSNINKSTGTTFGQVNMTSIANATAAANYNFSSTYNTTTGGISDIILFNNSACSGAEVVTSPEYYNLSNGVLTITDGGGVGIGNCGATATCNYCANITYYDSTYIQDSKTRTIWTIFPIIVGLGILLTIMGGFGLMNKFS